MHLTTTLIQLWKSASKLRRLLIAGTNTKCVLFFLFQAIQNGVRVLFVAPVMRHFFNSAKLGCDGVGTRAVEALESHSRYKDTPWEYLESEGTKTSVVVLVILYVRFSMNAFVLFSFSEYIERYGSRPVWADYRRNHKGGIPPQKTRKTCIVCNSLNTPLSPTLFQYTLAHSPCENPHNHLKGKLHTVTHEMCFCWTVSWSKRFLW